MTLLPATWHLALLGELAVLKTGPFGSALHKSDYTMDGVPIVNPMHIMSGTIVPSSTATITTETAERLSEFRLEAGDIVIGRRGQMGRCAVVTEAQKGWLCGTGSLIVRPISGLFPHYLQRYLSSSNVVSRLEGASVGSTMLNLNQRILLGLAVPVAPLNEQKRIADKLDALLARVDTCRARLDRVPLILKRFRQSVLAAATSGKLTEEWREKMSCTDEWPHVRLADVGELGRGKSKHRPRNDPRLYGGPYPFIQTGAVAQSGGRITHHTQTYNDFGLVQSKLWPVGTVCITIAANIADTAVLTYPACFPDSVVGFVAEPSKSVAEFIKWSIDVIRDHLESFAPATAQKNINLAVLNDVQFRCPPVDEQREIVRRVETLFAYADRLAARYSAARAQVEKLTPALLAKAFRGELVPQDPNDEPASALLQRIRATRAAQPQTARARIARAIETATT